MALEFKLSNSIRGGLIYLAGDSIAALLSNELDLLRAGGILFIGATLYAFEIPNYFNWIDKRMNGKTGLTSSMIRATLSMSFFNPLWIARHILFIKLFMGQFDQIGWGLVWVGTLSFVVNIPISLGANYVIQNKISLRNRFIASAIFSGIMAVYYSLSMNWFS